MSSTFSLDFDGASGYVEVTSPSGLPHIEDAKSISLWTQHDGVAARRIVCVLADSNTSGATAAIGLEINTDFGDITVRANTWGNTMLAEAFLGPGAANVPADTWFHVLYTCEAGQANPKIYINGVDRTFFPFTSAQTGSVAVLRLASANAAFPSPYHDRPIDDLAVFAGTLTSTDAANLASGSVTPLSLSPALLWRLEEGTGSTTADSSGNGNDGTLSAGATWSTDVPSELTGGGGGGDVTVTVSAAESTTWATQSPAISGSSLTTPAVETITWATQSPAITAGAIITPAAESATWAVQTTAITGNANVAPNEETTTWAVQTVVVSSGGDIAIAPDALSLILAINSPTIAGASNVSPSVLTTTWATQAPSISGGATFIATQLNSSWTIQLPAITGSSSVTTTAVSTTFAIQAPSIHAGGTVIVSNLSITWAAQTVTIHGSSVITSVNVNSTWIVRTPIIGEIVVTEGMGIIISPIGENIWS